jgi:hypothetical protein
MGVKKVLSLLGDKKLLVFESMVDAVINFSVEGDFAEFGVYQGGGLQKIAERLKLHLWDSEKLIHGYDTFQGLPYYGGRGLTQGRFACAMDQVRRNIGPQVYHSGNPVPIHLHATELPNGILKKPLCFAHVDLDLGDPTFLTLCEVGDLIRPEGIILVDDYDFPETPMVKPAVDSWFKLYGKFFEVIYSEGYQWAAKKIK